MAEKNYYEILGIPRTATPDQVKQRYRQLARKYHPDVAEDKASAKVMFLQISEAYQTLANEDRRLIYDMSIGGRSFNVDPPRRPSPPRPPQNPPGYQTPRPAQKPPPSASHAQSRARAEEQDRAKRAQIRKWLREAEGSLAIGQFRSATYACKEVIRMDTTNVKAHIILGDVYRVQGMSDQAIAMYTIAAQLDPRNVDVQNRLERLAKKSKPEPTPEQKTVNYQKAANLVGLGLGLYMLFAMGLSHDKPIQWLATHLSMVDSWNRPLLSSMIAVGMIAGFLLSVNERVQRLDEELVFKSVQDNGISYPIALLLLIFSLFSFYMAVVVYSVIAVMQETISKSVIITFTATGALILLSTIIYSHGPIQVLVFGGNVIFPSLMVGWMAGDIFRPSY